MSLTIGEVQTGLLLTSAAVSADAAAALLDVLPGGTVRTRQRPIGYAWSPDVLTGVDCFAPLNCQREVRVVGTPATRVCLTGGYVVQASTYATVRYDPTGRRRPWGHYLAQPGVIEVLGTEREENLAAGFLSGPAFSKALDLGAVNMRALAGIQRSEFLDRNPPFRSRRTRLRWSAQSPETESAGAAAGAAGPAGAEMVFTLGDNGLRTVRLHTDETDLRALAGFCDDLALHDWLLSTLLDLVERAMARSRPAIEIASMLRPAIDHLVHAWMPAVHISKSLASMWHEFDQNSGLSLQWQKTVERIRDQLSVGVIEALQPRDARRSERE